jgi:hypothetical protein
MPAEIKNIHEQAASTDQVFNELRKTNEKLLSYQVENRKLLDKVHVLNLQVEDLRIHNNRIQMQA